MVRRKDQLPEVHPAAAIFPWLPEEELEELVLSICDVGLLQPIVLTPDGMILDGRNRLNACKRAGVEPTFVVHEGDPVAFVTAANINRRHMTTGARAMAVAKMLADAGRRDNGRWDRGALDVITESGNSWNQRLTEAGHVIDHAPNLTHVVISGAVSLHAAHAEAIEARDAASSVEVRFSRLPNDLATQVTEERLTLHEAEVVHRDRDRKQAEERRDARTLLIRIVDLAAPEAAGNGFVEAWADHLGEVEPELCDRIHDAVSVLTDLVKRVQQ